MKYFLASLAFVSCSNRIVTTVPVGESAGNSSFLCSGSGQNITCSSPDGEPLEFLPAWFPPTGDCNHCLSTVIPGTLKANVKCPNGITFTTDLIPGPKGDKGDRGDTGATGNNGANGKDGINGSNGANGKDGLNGKDGIDGKSCVNGKNEYGDIYIECNGKREYFDNCNAFGGCWEFGARGNVFTIANTTTALPDLSTMTPEESVEVPSFNEFDRAWNLGYPGLPHRIEWYAIRFVGYIEVPACLAKKCVYRVTSDDGAKFSLDNSMVVDNDGLHSPRSKTGSVKAEAGWHKFKLDFFQGPRTQIALALEVSIDDGATFGLVPQDMLKFRK